MVWYYEPSDEMTKYLHNMQDAIKYALQVAYRMSVRDHEKGVPSPIAVRREVRDWFYSRYDYARHHVNPVCRAAVAMLRSYRKNHHGELRIPEVKRLAMRIDAELFRVVDGKLRITMQPDQYVWLPINTSNKHYEEDSRGRASELLITGRRVCLTFIVSEEKKPLGEKLAASDLNFKSIDSTKASSLGGQPALTGVETQPLKEIVRIQNDFSKRRRALQKHVRNPQKRAKKLREARGRQRNRVRDALHKLSTKQVKQNPDASFIFENLRGIRKNGETKSKKFRTYLNRWPYRLYQSMVEYKSQNRTLYVSPRGTSSECPVCGGKLEHPAWAVSRCATCGVDYDRDRLASLAILCRGMRLCGRPFAVSADASWRLLKDEYLYTPATPERGRAGRTEVADAPNGDVYESTHF
ncbi:MAG: IS200/IS605 family element transposase accessory protein TnpB [Thaumarchaeota archaeon]|nr:IS200/IS605 family element transposase accessory protein TnpB [Nitrososphaerota archaeon]